MLWDDAERLKIGAGTDQACVYERGTSSCRCYKTHTPTPDSARMTSRIEVFYTSIMSNPKIRSK